MAASRQYFGFYEWRTVPLRDWVNQHAIHNYHIKRWTTRITSTTLASSCTRALAQHDVHKHELTTFEMKYKIASFELNFLCPYYSKPSWPPNLNLTYFSSSWRKSSINIRLSWGKWPGGVGFLHNRNSTIAYLLFSSEKWRGRGYFLFTVIF